MTKTNYQGIPVSALKGAQSDQQQSLNQLQNASDNNSSAIDSLTGRVGASETDVGQLQTDVGQLQTDVSAAEGDILTLQNLTVPEWPPITASGELTFLAASLTNHGIAYTTPANRLLGVPFVPRVDMVIDRLGVLPFGSQGAGLYRVAIWDYATETLVVQTDTIDLSTFGNEYCYGDITDTALNAGTRYMVGVSGNGAGTLRCWHLDGNVTNPSLVTTDWPQNVATSTPMDPTVARVDVDFPITVGRFHRPILVARIA